MARIGNLTVEAISRAKPRAIDRWLTDQDGRRGGQLVLRITPSGTKSFYFRFTQPAEHGGDGKRGEGRRINIPLGAFTTRKNDGVETAALTLEEARRKRDEFRALYLKHGDLREYFRRLEEDRVAAEKRAKLERERDLTLTLKALADAYIEHLEARGKKRSAQDVRNLTKLHLASYAEMPARTVTHREVTAVLRRLVEAGKGRTAAKLRSYLRAAFALAVRAERDPAVPSKFIAFGLETNPVEDTDSLSQFTRARDRVLTQAELFAFWKRIDGVESEPVRDALKLLLLLGGQRVGQLLRLEVGDVDMDAHMLRLYDPKGRRTTPRVHELPITDPAAAVLEPMLKRAKTLETTWMFTSDGKRRLHPDTVTLAARYICTDMEVAEEAKSLFQLRDLRRTCETMLAAMGVHRDVRARLLSHGLGGVQDRHYDRHDYQGELRAVLERWAQRLTGAEGTVVPIGTAAA